MSLLSDLGYYASQAGPSMTQGLVQGQQTLINLQEAQKERELKQQGIDVERMRALADATAPARQDAGKLATQLDASRPNFLVGLKDQLSRGLITQDQYDSAVSEYDARRQGYWDFARGKDLWGHGLAFHETSPAPDGGTVSPPQPAGSPVLSQPVSRAPVGGTDSEAGTRPPLEAGLVVPGTYHPNQPMPGENQGPQGLPQIPGVPVHPAVAAALSTGLGSLLGPVGAGMGEKLGMSLPTAPSAPPTALSPPAVASKPAPAPTQRPATMAAASNAGTGLPPGVPKGYNQLLYTGIGGAQMYGDGKGNLFQYDPNRVVTPMTADQKQKYTENYPGLQEARQRTQEALTRLDLARRTPGADTRQYDTDYRDAVTAENSLRQNAIAEAEKVDQAIRESSDAFNRGFQATGAGIASRSQADLTAAQTTKTGHETQLVDAQRRQTDAEAAYNQARTNTERQTARKAMYDANLAALQAQNYPKEQAIRIAKLNLDLKDANIQHETNVQGAGYARLKAKDPGLTDNYEHITTKLSDRDINRITTPIGSLRFGGSQGGQGVYADTAWQVVKASEGYLNDPDPQVRQAAQRVHDEALGWMRRATAMVSAGATDQVRGNVPSPGAWHGKDLWDQYRKPDDTGAEAKTRLPGYRPNLPPDKQPPSVQNNLHAMDLWYHFNQLQEGRSNVRVPDVYATPGSTLMNAGARALREVAPQKFGGTAIQNP